MTMEQQAYEKEWKRCCTCGTRRPMRELEESGSMPTSWWCKDKKWCHQQPGAQPASAG